MANAHRAGPESHSNARDDRLARLAESRITNVSEKSIDEWEAADTAQRLTQLHDRARAYMNQLTGEENSESTPESAYTLAQQDMALARYRASRHRTDSVATQESTNMPNRPLDRQFGSDGNQYNPYAPHTSEEYMLQEIEAGRMHPEMMDMSQRPLNLPRPPLSGTDPDHSLTHTHAGGSGASWMASGHRTGSMQSVNYDLSDPRELSWFQHPYDGSTAAEGFGVPGFPTPMLPYSNFVRSPASSQSIYGMSLDSVFSSQGSTLDSQASLTSLDPANLNEILTSGVPRQSYPPLNGRERKRVGKPSLIVKLKTPCVQEPSQTSVSLRRGRSNASSSSETSSAAQTPQISRPFNLRSRENAGMNSTNARPRPGWDSQAVRRLTRRAEAIQSSHRKRRRDAASTQDANMEGTMVPMAAPTQGLWIHLLAFCSPAYTIQLPGVMVDVLVLEHPSRSNAPSCVPTLLYSSRARHR